VVRLRDLRLLGHLHRGEHHGFVVSFLVWSVVLGFVLGAATVTGLAAVLSESAMDSNGWRIPFLLAGVLGVVGSTSGCA
jgi:MHS family proline/betaine transporter-like MFS transporter